MKNSLIELYRFILIFWIVIYHYTTRCSQLYPDIINYSLNFHNGGYVGVFIFFVISGYFYASSINRRIFTEFFSIIKFSINKYWRLFPAYLISIILIFVVVSIWKLEGRESNFFILIGNLLIWHPYCGYIDSAHWFIASLIRIQILLIFVYYICQSNIRNTILLLLSVSTIIYILDNNFNIAVINKISYVISNRNLLIFLLGMLIWLIKNKEVKLNYLILVLFIIMLFLFYENNYLMPLCFLVFLFLLNNRISLIKINPLVIYLGRISFSWYLIHQNIGLIIIRELNYSGLTSELYLLIPIVITLCIAIFVDYIANKFPKKIYK